MAKSRSELWGEKRDLWKRMTDIQAAATERGEARTQEEDGQYDAAAARIQQIEEIMRQEDEHEARKRDMTEPQRKRDLSDPEDRDDDDTPPIASAEYRRAHDRYLRMGEHRLNAEDRATLGRASTREMSSLIGADGGYLVPSTFLDRITERKKWYGGALAAGPTVITTGSGEEINWPTFDGTALEGEIIGENEEVGDTDLEFGNKRLGAYIYSSKVVKAPFSLVQDSFFDLEGFIARASGTALGRIQNKHLTVGTGAGQPQGMVTGASMGPVAVTTSATAIKWEEIVDLEHSVDVAYRDPSRTKFMLHDLTLATIRKLAETGTGRPLWEPSLKEGVASTYNGYKYVINNDMPVAAANNKSILFGDFEAFYIVRRVTGLLVVRLDQLYARKLQMGYFTAERMDAGVQDSAAVKALVMHS